MLRGDGSGQSGLQSVVLVTLILVAVALECLDAWQEWLEIPCDAVYQIQTLGEVL